MYFNKYPLSQNFSYASAFRPEDGFIFQNSKPRPVQFIEYADDVFRLSVGGNGWDHSSSQAKLSPQPWTGANQYQLHLNEDASLRITNAEGVTLLESLPGRTFGKNGTASLFRFVHQPEFRYYGGGSKMIGLEYTGKRTKFWNTDAFADFPIEHIEVGRPDPYYVSVPYLIIKTPAGWVGLLYNNAEAAFLSAAAEVDIEGFAKVDVGDGRSINFGSESGRPDLFILAAPDLAVLTENFQRLVGTVPLPPLWALGYQQCRWGYESTAQLRELDAKFAEHQIPVDGLWLDIDYMDGFRVFTTNPEKIPEPKKEFTELLEKGHPVVPIIDPGVKFDPGYSVYESGKTADIYCKNPEGEDFIGLVWPGLTVFPDFSREEARSWWAEQVRAFAELGIIGAWLDMNDPSVGFANLYDMRFGPQGSQSHESFHNQYGFGMAQATRAGFEAAHPNRRIFLVSRSSYLSGGQFSAVWTGDNVSNYHYLRSSIALQINLALSGFPLNGGDIGGFGRDTTPTLLRDWMKAACLSSFCRNHTITKSVRQEPWAFDQLTLDVCRDFIRLRYLLLPYLYNCFVAQAEKGSAVLRPLFYDFENTPEVVLDYVDDAFMTGPSILQAPFVDPDNPSREVPLPGSQGWFDPFTNQWLEGNQILPSISRSDQTTPFFLREGTIIPLRRTNSPGDAATDLREVDFLIVARAQTTSPIRYSYQADDGSSLDFKTGKFSRIEIHATMDQGTVAVTTETRCSAYGQVHARFCLIDPSLRLKVSGEIVPSGSHSIEFASAQIPSSISSIVDI